MKEFLESSQLEDADNQIDNQDEINEYDEQNE